MRFLSGGAAQTVGLIRAIEEQTGCLLYGSTSKVEVSRDFKEDYLVNTAPQYSSLLVCDEKCFSAKRNVPLIAISLLRKRLLKIRKALMSSTVLQLLSFFCVALAGVQYYVGGQESALQIEQARLQNEIKGKSKTCYRKGEQKRFLRSVSHIEQLEKRRLDQ